jgi:hypothetical protein
MEQKHVFSIDCCALRGTAGKGATVVVIRDKGGHVFGGYAPEAWEKHGSFYGSFSARIFSLLPVLAAYTPSGVNQNFQFCGQGFARVPNGFGWGGQVRHMGHMPQGRTTLAILSTKRVRQHTGMTTLATASTHDSTVLFSTVTLPIVAVIYKCHVILLLTITMRG